MSVSFGRMARALLLTGGIATALALPSIAGTPLLPNDRVRAHGSSWPRRRWDNDGNDDRTNDNSDERNIEGQVLELHKDMNPPEALIGMVGGNVWARIYNDQAEPQRDWPRRLCPYAGRVRREGHLRCVSGDVIDDGDDNDND